MNSLLAYLGIDAQYTGDELRRSHTGKNFRLTADALCLEHGVAITSGELQFWVNQEKSAVTKHLSRVLRPDATVHRALAVLTATFTTAVVTSSALDRVDACLQATRLSAMLGKNPIFSAEDSLTAPASKPDPAIYRHACEQMRVAGDEVVVVEDSVAGVESAAAAGLPVVGLMHFVPAAERPRLALDLKAAGATVVAESWDDVVRLLTRRREFEGSR
jgi:beta-phosphoglucomutase-like phosphatase (HAD superfamily)